MSLRCLLIVAHFLGKIQPGCRERNIHEIFNHLTVVKQQHKFVLPFADLEALLNLHLDEDYDVL